MKYLIASEGNTMEGGVSSHFGKAPFFITYDDETKKIDT
jgi:predicted Fe-Mo cluster-binding NifX family protein